MGILTLRLGLGLGRMLGLELGRHDVPGLKNTGVSFLASGCRGPLKPLLCEEQKLTLTMDYQRYLHRDLSQKYHA